MKAAIFGCAGTTLTADERAFFRDADPLGFILFARNIETPEQTRRLTDELRSCVARAEAPVLIDQEGGRVLRLRHPFDADVDGVGRVDLGHRDVLVLELLAEPLALLIGDEAEGVFRLHAQHEVDAALQIQTQMDTVFPVLNDLRLGLGDADDEEHAHQKYSEDDQNADSKIIVH